MESKQRDDLTPYFLWLEGSQTFKGHIFLVSSGHVYQVNVGSSVMRCSRSGLHLPSKNGSGNHVALPCSDATRYPSKKGKLRKDWDANPLTGHNPCTSRRIVTNYETI